MKNIVCLLVALSAAPASAQAPTGPVPLSQGLKNQHNAIKRNLTEAAAKMPEEHYAFKPTPDVRSFGELVGHVANANYLLCARAKGEANPSKTDFEKTTAKADLVKALDEAIAYCDAVYSAQTDASVTELLKVPGPNNTTVEVARGSGLFANVAHNNEHYGNIVTYMRLKGLVPPSTERAQRR
jgi:uncharacterized damage-inducible protein DinB